MARSPRTSFPRTVTLVEAFRRILRAQYPERPGLADEIKSYAWLYFDPNRRVVDPYYVDVGGERFWRGEVRPGEGREDEVKAFKDAHRWLEEFVRQEHGKFRLRGVLDPRKPLDDIDPADVRDSRPHVFDGKLRVFDGNKHVKTYYRVHCYEIDVDRCVAELRSEAKPGKRTSPAGLGRFTEDYKASLNGKVPPTEAEFTAAANNAGHYRPRKEMRQAWHNAFGPGRPGRRSTKSPES
jgi:nucleoid DNA-binding protein